MERKSAKISIRGLWKVFGADPASALALARDGLSKAELLDAHGAVLALQDVDLEMPAQALQVVMGLSGSGKSTLVRHINRLIEPTAGAVAVDDDDVLAMDAEQLRDLRRFKMSMVFQKFALLPHRTVVQNVGYGLEIQGVEAEQVRKRAQDWVERVGLAGYEDHYPNQLSGGMQQRVGLARALATDAEILLMDEAFSALDPLIRKEMQSVLLHLQSELKKTIVFITHDLDEALALADRIAILRDGAVVQSGDPQEILMRPADDYVAAFTRDVNRARCLRIRAIMSPADPGLNGAPALLQTLSIEEALPRLAAAPEGRCAVADASGALLGAVTLKAAIDAIGPGRGAADAS